MRYTLLVLALLLFGSCQQGEKSVTLDIAAKPFEKLSDYHFFVGKLADLSPNERVLPYDLNTPLFTDYAHKARFVWIPEGESADFTNEEVLDFPIGTVLIKNFFYQNDESKVDAGRRIIETRLLVHQEDGWEPHTYVWNEAQTEATLDIVGDILAVNWKDAAGEAMHANYIIPNKNQCKGCHSHDDEIAPIGPKGRNLNKSYQYADGEMNQLDKWAQVGYLTGYQPDQDLEKTAVWDDAENYSLHHRAMAYLDANCGHCHNPHGPGGTTGLNLVYDAPLDLTLGINKPPVAAGRATGGFSYSIVKGQADESIMLHRMESTEPGVMMPELGRTLAHTEGIELIRDWINDMK